MMSPKPAPPEPAPHAREVQPSAVGAGEFNRRVGASAPIEIRIFELSDDRPRDALVRAQPAGSIFHLSGWRRAVERVFDHEPRDLIAWQGSEIVGVLPLMLCATPLGRKHLISVPYGVYGGPVARTLDVERALVDAAVKMARDERVGRLELRCLADPGLPELAPSNLYATFIQPLPDDPAEVMKRMPKRARAEVRKAIENHALVMSAGAWYLDDLFELFHESKKHLGSPGLPKEWFQALLEELGSDAVLHVARTGASGSAQPIAATMSFVFRDQLVFYYIGTALDANRAYNATNYLVTRLQEWAVERGLKQFDLGRSRVDSGPYEFKKHQGFEPTPLHYRYLLVKSRNLPSFNPSNPKTEKLRGTWSKLPSWVTRPLSAELMRYLP
jgi:FemAB-related protein (PEP-CTERM system-associated)